MFIDADLQLMGLASSDDLEEVTIEDFVVKGVSAFSRLLEQPENLKVELTFVKDWISLNLIKFPDCEDQRD